MMSTGFPDDSDSKESACNVGDLGSIPGLGRSPGEGNGNPLQYSCLGNPMDRGTWQATGGCKESDTTDRLTLSLFFFKYVHNLLFLSVRFLRFSCCLVAKSCLTLRSHGLWPTRLLCPWDFLGKNTGAGCHFLLQRFFLTQGSNRCLRGGFFTTDLPLEKPVCRSGSNS